MALGKLALTGKSNSFAFCVFVWFQPSSTAALYAQASVNSVAKSRYSYLPGGPGILREIYQKHLRTASNLIRSKQHLLAVLNSYFRDATTLTLNYNHLHRCRYRQFVLQANRCRLYARKRRWRRLPVATSGYMFAIQRHSDSVSEVEVQRCPTYVV